MIRIDGIEYACEEEFICCNIDEPCRMNEEVDCCGCGDCLRI